MVYIEGFLTEFESDYLKQLANPLYEESEVRKYEDDGSKTVNIDRNHRKSDTAWLPSEDPVVSCVRERAAEFEGYAPANGTMDALAAVRYKPGGRFGMHHDWDTDRKKDVDRPWGNSKRFGRPWCRWTDCDFEGDGVAVRPIKGNALFWVNFREDGTGIHETIHAGQPLLEGTKIGMNIWTHGLIGAEGGGLRDD
ncbi:hypothetical protein M406DRAFT_327593 [Cryphonectria parasitica EP155]|uniref:Prolyl 4-hydroxylase alpha subunit domain-containing protein n=1 Tax=Cryphonectria parasitica (strain ATCC 38755 / EP155) TaxID=660469 RepID=A0A9P5CT98_CRYP1|nr:uncharacterized protein M406DRAFT_327593 [Cryphonectria parasitica EP155]KAF3769191.1 hypothetical protein M406DRAFT_327593 [Cryphonectria parasitica EP155]